MGDPLGTTASIVAVLGLTDTVVKYLNDVKDASEDRKKILLEISNAHGLLYTLKDLAERQPSGNVKSLDVPNGPLAQFKSALERLAVKLAPVTGRKKIEKALGWPFQKEDVADILRTIERQKSLFILALQEDHM